MSRDENVAGLEYIRRTYKVPARVGQRIRFDWQFPPREGVIIGANGGTLKVQFDDSARIEYAHPTWHIEYLTSDGAS
ncbi:hypothetical protein [Rhodococcoides fascians]|uniref:hypothetical protein n=1 Tax=Rhodococcoides fascians TaxID=1828 RepID=UPI00050BDC25|nr:hypothetical protein [Rhodococcus fascians]